MRHRFIGRDDAVVRRHLSTGSRMAQIEVDGVDLSTVDAGWYRSRIGVVSQDPRLFSMTIRENIAYGLPHVRRCCIASHLQMSPRFWTSAAATASPSETHLHRAERRCCCSPSRPHNNTIRAE